MRGFDFLFFLLALLCLSQGYHDKILLRDIQVLTFNEGQMTTGRRSSPVQQLVMTRGNSAYAPKSVQCRNVGFDGQDVNWKCEAPNMKNGYDLGRTIVSCEGYDYPNDPYVLVGSCGLEYELTGPTNQNVNYPPRPVVVRQSDDSLFGFVIVVLCIGLGAWLVLGCLTATPSPRLRTPSVRPSSTTTTTTTTTTSPHPPPSAPPAPTYDQSPLYQPPPPSTHTTTHTYVEHHPAPSSGNDFAAGYVAGSWDESLRRRTVTPFVTPVVPFGTTVVTPTVPIYPVVPQPSVVVIEPQHQNIAGDTHTSTSFAETKRR